MRVGTAEGRLPCARPQGGRLATTTQARQLCRNFGRQRGNIWKLVATGRATFAALCSTGEDARDLTAMRPLILCRERLDRLLSVLSRQGGEETLRQLSRRFGIWSWEAEQAAALGWVEIIARRPRIGRPSRVVRCLNNSQSAKLPPRRRDIEPEICFRHRDFAFEWSTRAIRGGSPWLGLPGIGSAYARIYGEKKNRNARDAAASRLAKHSDVRAVRHWVCAQLGREVPLDEPMPRTRSGIRDRLRELGSWRARCI